MRRYCEKNGITTTQYAMRFTTKEQQNKYQKRHYEKKARAAGVPVRGSAEDLANRSRASKKANAARWGKATTNE